MVASDKLFFWLFQNQPDRILQLQSDLPADAGGYRFSAPVLKEREYRLDGLLLPPPERPDLPALILEAQMAADVGFLRRLYAETARLLQQQPGIGPWRVTDPTAPPLLKALALLLQPERELPATTALLRAQVKGTAQAAEIDDVIAAILISRFNGRSILELCAMGGISLDDFTQSVAYRDIYGLGRQESPQEGELDLALRLLQRRCGAFSAQQEARIWELPLPQLEALGEVLLDFQGSGDRNIWLAAHV